MSTLTRQAYGMWFDDISESGGAMPPMVDFTGNEGSGDILSDLSVAKSRGVRCILKITGGPNQSKDSIGQFSVTSWKNKMDEAYAANTVQQQNNAGLPSADWTDTAVQANVKTIGGYSDVALQLLEQSPNQIVDEVVTTDLMAAYNKFLDQQVIAGDGLNTNSLNGGHLLNVMDGASRGLPFLEPR